MNWEKSRALTPLKRDLLRSFFERHREFFLTGGSALGIFYLDHRLSYDLDLFTETEVDCHLLDNSVRDISRDIGSTSRTITASPTFRRYAFTRDEDREILDLVIERNPQLDVEKEQFGAIRVDTLREIGVNKICTLIGRCDLKDIIDLYFLERHGFRVEEHIEEAREKEGGIDPAVISHLLSDVYPESVPEYVIDPLDLADLGRYIRDLERRFAEMSFPE